LDAALTSGDEKVFGCRPMKNGAAKSAVMAGVRKPPREEIAGGGYAGGAGLMAI